MPEVIAGGWHASDIPSIIVSRGEMSIQSDPFIADAGSQASAPPSRQFGIALIITAYAFFAVLDADAKWLSRYLPVMEVVWARYLGASLFAMLAANPLSQPNLFKTNRFWLQNARALTLLASTVLNFYALLYLQLAETVSISFAMPLVVALLSGPILGEWVGPRRLAAICVGFVGVLVVTRPGSSGFHPAMLLSLTGTLCYAAYGITTRMLAATDSSRTTLAYSSLLGAVGLTPLLPWFWIWPQDALTWALMAGAGLCGAVGHWFLIAAHRHAPASILAPFIYTELLWMVGLGYVVFGDRPGIWTLAGGCIVIASGLYLWYRERVVKGIAG